MLVVAAIALRFNVTLLFISALTVACAHTLAVYLFVLESPAYLARVGKHKDAVVVLQTLNRFNGSRIQSDACENWATVEPMSNTASYWILLSNWRRFSTTAMCCVIVMTVNYSSYGLLFILPSVLPTSDAAPLALGILANTGAALLAMVFGHLISRKSLMLGSLSFAAVLTASGIVFQPLAPEVEVAIICGQLGAIAVAFFGVYLYLVEVSETAIRATSTGCAMMTGRLAAVAAPLFSVWLGHVRFLALMAILQLVSAGIVTAFRVEPNMRQLGEIAAENQKLVVTKER